MDLVTPGCFFACLDLANAYCSVKFQESNFKATGFKWRFNNDKHYTYMIDVRLPFGASQCPLIFHSIMQAVSAFMTKKGFNTILCYLDDFLNMVSTYDECSEALYVLLRLLWELGFHINYNKLEGLCQGLVFLGMILDSVSMTLSISQRKMG